MLQHPSARRAHPPAVAPPADLLPSVRAIWDRQAPHALAAGTLTAGTALAFGRYCQVAALERAESQSPAAGGENHLGLLDLLAQLERQFLLAPPAR